MAEFWARFQTGMEIAVAGNQSHKLLGVRDGFLRFFREGLDQWLSLAVVPQPATGVPGGLPVSDEEAITLARRAAADLEEELSGQYHFYVSNEGGLHHVEVDGEVRYFVRSWTVIRSALGESWGASGSVQLPERLVAGLQSDEVPMAVPGRRRSGGMIASLTGGMESRRTAVATATLHAIATLFYGTMESRPGERH